MATLIDSSIWCSRSEGNGYSVNLAKLLGRLVLAYTIAIAVLLLGGMGEAPVPFLRAKR